MKITIYLSNGQTEYTINKTLQEIIYEIYELFPDNLGFKIVKEEYYIIKLIDEISDLLGDNYEIYKLEDNANEIFRKGDKNE